MKNLSVLAMLQFSGQNFISRYHLTLLFENGCGNRVTTNAKCYANMLVTFSLEHGNDKEKIFEEDGATNHTANIILMN